MGPPFCSSPLWDLNATWYTDHPDFTPCFHETVLVYLPCAFLWVLAPAQVYLGHWNKARNVPWCPRSALRLGLAAVLAVLAVVDLGLEAGMMVRGGGGVAVANVVGPIVLLLTYLLSLFLSYYSRKMGLVTSGILFTFFLLLSLSNSFTFASLVRFNQQTWRQDQVLLGLVNYAVLVVVLFLHFWADPVPTYRDVSQQVDKPSPELTASFPNKMFFSWVDSIIYRGWKRPLTSDDLADLDVNDTSSEISQNWERNWNKQKEKRKGERLSIVPTLNACFGWSFLNGCFIQLLSVLLGQVGPNILSLLIDFVSNGEPYWKGYLYTILLVVTNILRTICTSQYFWVLQLIGLRVRTALTSALYKKSLLISAATRKVRTVGETVNLMAIDTQRFMDILTTLNVIWTSPLIIGLSLFFLWGYLGPSCLAGLAVMVILIPINSVISTYMRRYQFANMMTKDKRIKIMNEVLDGVKVLKLYAWEPSFGKRIMMIREVEVVTLKKMSYLGAIQTFLFNSAPFMVAVASFATYVLSSPNNVLDAQRAFVSISFFNLMRQPLLQLPNLIVQLIQMQVSLKRVNDFLNSEELDPLAISHNEDQVDAISMDNSSFAWDNDTENKPTVDSFNLGIKRGDLVAVVGQVGSGKSSFLSALTADMEKLSGSVNVAGSVAYVPQQAWIQNATLKYNITFGRKFEEYVYNTVVDSCAMRPDFAILDRGDMTEIGEKGINLSGGQKQRVSLARAIYSNRDIYLLDDPLSAVDTHVGKHIFENVISTSTGLLKNKTRVLVTHSVSYLSECDLILVIKDGSVAQKGTYKELLEQGGDFAEYLVQHIHDEEVTGSDSEHASDIEQAKHDLEEALGKEVVEETIRRTSVVSQKSGISTITGKRKTAMKGKDRLDLSNKPSIPFSKDKPDGMTAKGPRRGGLMVDEKMETKAVSNKVYIYYTKAVGINVVIVTLVCAVLNQVFSVGTNVWLSVWSDDPNSEVPSVRDMYLGVYGALGAATAIAVMLQSLIITIGGLNASSKLHNKMLMNVLRAPMSFFDTNPKGRVINRFAKDVDYVDRQIPTTFSNLIRLFFMVLGTVFVICFANPIFIVVIIPLSVLYYFLQQIFVKTSRQVKRLESITRSPIYSHFSETLSGISTIRAYDLQARFTGECNSKVDLNQVSYHVFLSTTRWLSVRLEMLGNVIVLFAALFAVLGRETMNPGTVGLSLSYASQITLILTFLIRQTSQIETNMVSVERIQEYQDDLDQEAEYDRPGFDPSDDWPQKGKIVFLDYQTKYRPGLDLVLKGITCKIRSQEKVGIIGRTGAGKSSLTMSLFRIIEATSGSISIDGVPIGDLGLGYLRSRLTIMPQDPILFSGTLRENLDPFEASTDEQIWNALKHAHLFEFVARQPEGLQYEIAEGGSNLSVGQKQLVCLARALLRKTRILVLDEATAAVDLETDDLIQETIKREFSDSTVLTIAHRLNTIMDSDRVMVLSDGKILEFDNPEKLLKRKDSVFYNMAKEAGLVK